MESLYFLIPLSIFFTVGAVALFFWAVNSGQYDDLESEGERILFEDELSETQQKNSATSPELEPLPEDKQDKSTELEKPDD